MDQTFLVGIVLLEEIGVPEENHEPAASAGNNCFIIPKLYLQ